MTAPAPISISLSQQAWALNEVLQQRIKGYPKLVSGGKLKQSEADYRISAVRAAWETVNALDTLHRVGPVLSQVQLNLFKAWTERACTLLQRDEPWADIAETFVPDITTSEVVAIAHLIRDLAILARRADLVA